MTKIVIIGAAGYLGMQLTEKLSTYNYDITGITHANGYFLLQKYKIHVETPENYLKIGKADIIINLAYPKSAPLTHTKANRKIGRMIKALCQDNTQIIHTSTQAVFSYDLSFPIAAKAMKNRLDYPYITSKIYLENVLRRLLGNQYELHILRLGNIWGPGSPAWTTNLINRITTGDVIGIKGKDGYANLTDVENIVSYIHYLITHRYQKGCFFHHLAEFSDSKWSYWINLIANELKIEPIYIDYPIAYAHTITDEIKAILRQYSLKQSLKQLANARLTGALLRKTLFNKFPQRLVAYLEQKNMIKDFKPYYHGLNINDDLLTIMTCPKEFKSVTDKNWHNKISINESWQKINDWMKSAGYIA
jgi:nucleoside-diphosphate-sugar epimerase